MPFGSLMQSSKDTQENEVVQEIDTSLQTTSLKRNDESLDAVEPCSAESFTNQKEFCLNLYLNPAQTTNEE